MGLCPQRRNCLGISRIRYETRHCLTHFVVEEWRGAGKVGQRDFIGLHGKGVGLKTLDRASEVIDRVVCPRHRAVPTRVLRGHGKGRIGFFGKAHLKLDGFPCIIQYAASAIND